MLFRSMSARLDVKGVVAMAAPHGLPRDYPNWFLRAASKVIRFKPKGKGKPGSGWFDKAEHREHIAYPQNPVRSVAELRELMIEMHAALPKVRVPVLLIHSKDDRYVLPENMERIYAGLVNARDKTKHYITGSGHVLPRDAARLQVFQSTVEFIHRVESKSK